VVGVRVVVVVESFFGRTEELGALVAAALETAGAQVELFVASRAPCDLHLADLVVVGAPTHTGGLSSRASRWAHAQYWGDPGGPLRRHRPHGRPARRTSVREWVARARWRPGTAAAVFDTRARHRLPGTAADALARRLVRRGARLVVPPEGFVVRGVSGPLRDGELARATAWATDVLAAARDVHPPRPGTEDPGTQRGSR
jgi:hypothetical protein